jgi:hypothetical protein
VTGSTPLPGLCPIWLRAGSTLITPIVALQQKISFRIYIPLLYCLLKQAIEGKIKGEMEVTRRRKKLLDDLKDKRGYSHLKEVLDLSTDRILNDC